MARRFQFGLRALPLAASAVGPALLVGRRLMSLSWLGALFIALICTLLAVLLAQTATPKKAVHLLVSSPDTPFSGCGQRPCLRSAASEVLFQHRID